uniref:Tautomerase cis-CaaD-like domain-containing protein n=1 Tax=Panagrolaimus superbus TaxID=310955 RepID=A0A914YA75_9BILA
MPLHRIYHTPGQFSKDQKKDLADAITKIYTGLNGAGLPAFYVVVIFIPIVESNFYVGGETTKNFVRISIQHIARNFDSHEQAKGFLDRYENALAPFIKERSFDWEV